MKILPVTSPEFKPYGRIVEGCGVEGILSALAGRPLPDGVGDGQGEQALFARAREVGEQQRRRGAGAIYRIGQPYSFSPGLRPVSRILISLYGS